MTAVRILDRWSQSAGAAANEDAAGATGEGDLGAAWVIDGATGLADRSYLDSASSDAAWYARQLSEAFETWSICAPPALPAHLMRKAIEAVAAEFFASIALDTAVEAIPPYALPSAAVAWVRWHPDRRIEFAALGDCRALLKPATGPVIALGTTSADCSDEQINTEIRRLHASGITEPKQIWALAKDRLRASRARMNQPDGYWVFGVDPTAADHLDRQTLVVGPPFLLLLVSDGFYRLVDTYQRYTRAELVDRAAEVGLDVLGRELRAIEAADPDCRRYPRLKPADDATAMLIAG